MNKGGVPTMVEVTHAFSTFSLPIFIEGIDEYVFFDKLEQQGYHLYNDNTAHLLAYGDAVRDDVSQLKKYFMPYIEGKLFAKRNIEGFKRFFKPFHQHGKLIEENKQYPFTITAVEWFLCPFQIAFLILHIKHSELETFDRTKAFMRCFRDFHHAYTFNIMDHQYDSLQHFFNDVLLASLPELQIQKTENSYTRTFENFQDELLLASHFITTSQTITDKQLFLLNEGEGSFIKNAAMAQYISDDYIGGYLDAHEFRRYDPYVRYVQSDDIGTIITTFEDTEVAWQQMKRYFNGPLFYQVFYHYFLKMTLLNFSNDYAKLQWQKDKGYVQELVKNMTMFEAHYYFYEISTQSEELAVSSLLRKTLDIQRVYEEAKSSLQHLFTIQEQVADMRQNTLLFFLTMSTVLSGAFGMNLVIEEWKEGFTLSMLGKYSLLEWFVFIVILISIVAAIFFTVQQLIVLLRNIHYKRMRQKQRLEKE